MFKFFKSQLNPTNLTSPVGGSISAQELTGFMGELFPVVQAPPFDSDLEAAQYRKVFVKNTFDETSNHTKLWIDAAQHPGQVLIGIGPDTSIPNGRVPPTGVLSWSSPSNYASGVSVGTIPPNGEVAVWLKQSLTKITEPDPYATLRLYVGGVLE